MMQRYNNYFTHAIINAKKIKINAEIILAIVIHTERIMVIHNISLKISLYISHLIYWVNHLLPLLTNHHTHQ